MGSIKINFEILLINFKKKKAIHSSNINEFTVYYSNLFVSDSMAHDEAHKTTESKLNNDWLKSTLFLNRIKPIEISSVIYYVNYGPSKLPKW